MRHVVEQRIKVVSLAGLEVIPTPGHTNNDVSVIVENTRYGVVAITGDLFEKEGDIEQEGLWMQYSENDELQKKNREVILRKADFIVPGHGKMFKNPKKQTSLAIVKN